jgi:hypothetical protein
MLRSTEIKLHKSGKLRGFIHKDPAMQLLRSQSGSRTMRRMAINPQQKPTFHKVGHFHANTQHQHAFPLLSHDDFGNSDQSNNTKHIMYSMYMPKRNKGTAPWFRGADTYSVKYCEQGRYEYQRYLMINRFPSEYKRHFMRFLGYIRSGKKHSSNATLPQEALHWLLRMIVDNFNPQHVHYQAAMSTLLESKEHQMARDVWKIMERQQTWPCTTTISTYLEVCIAAQEKTWALEAWNRYCTELKFLEEGEADPKPVSRIPFSLNRDELLHLPKWKKHFDHDPNLDVTDLNRFNKTREIYGKMALVMLAAGDLQAFETFFAPFAKAMQETPTPVPQPPNPHLVQRPRWSPYEKPESVVNDAWRLEDTKKIVALGASVTTTGEVKPQFLTNEQYLTHIVYRALNILAAQQKELKTDASPSSPHMVAANLKLGTDLVERLFSTLGNRMATMPTENLLASILELQLESTASTASLSVVESLRTSADAFLERKAKSAGAAAGAVREMLPATSYLVLLRACAREGAVDPVTSKRAAAFDPKATMATLAALTTEMHRNNTITWSADMHLAVVETMVRCGTMKANDYFVKNVLRSFTWDARFLEALYQEYRRHDNIDLWAELTKRSLVWCARYDVVASEDLKRAIEDDYEIIKVQTRTFRELAVFQFRDMEEKRHARNPINELPNPWLDYVAHALPFPDRDAGYPDEYGDIGQWRAPGGPGSPTKGPGYYAPKMEGEHQKGYTAEWRDLKNPMKPPAFPNPWERKYKQYARGQHPSYDMVYAGPMPEIFPGRHDWRKPTRWDYHDIEKQNKFRSSGPW